MSKKSGVGTFIVGAALGAGLGLLFAPKKGSETRKELKALLDDFVDQIKNIDKDDNKNEFDAKVKKIKKELNDLDKEKILSIAKDKAAELKDQAQELVDLAIDKGTPILRDAAEEVRTKVVEVTKEVLKRLEKAEK